MFKHDFEYIKPGKASVLIDGQFGSTGKGLLAAYLADQKQNKVDFAVTNASANAGHTTKFLDGRKEIVCFHLPTFGVIQRDCIIYINAGAIIDVEILLKEIDEQGVKDRIFIHPMACIISKENSESEKQLSASTTKFASTQKGVGAALSGKIKREAKVAKDIPELKPYIKEIDLNEELGKGAKVSVEVPQGYSLSVNGPFYPYCTSRNCTVAAGLNDANIHPDFLGEISMSLRTFPIRVGNIYDAEGKVIGYSGPCYNDQRELTWEEVGVVEERTTVTKRVRRVFTWSDEQFVAAVKDNRPSILFLNFVNYMRYEDVKILIKKIEWQYEQVMLKKPEMLFGFGPNIEQVSPDFEDSKFNLMGATVYDTTRKY